MKQPGDGFHRSAANWTNFIGFAIRIELRQFRGRAGVTVLAAAIPTAFSDVPGNLQMPPGRNCNRTIRT